MTLDDLLTAVDHLPPDELTQLKAKIAEREAQQRAVDEAWSRIDEILTAFWGDSTEEEKQEILDAIRTKSPPSTKGI